MAAAELAAVGTTLFKVVEGGAAASAGFVALTPIMEAVAATLGVGFIIGQIIPDEIQNRIYEKMKDAIGNVIEGIKDIGEDYISLFTDEKKVPMYIYEENGVIKTGLDENVFKAALNGMIEEGIFEKNGTVTPLPTTVIRGGDYMPEINPGDLYFNMGANYERDKFTTDKPSFANIINTELIPLIKRIQEKGISVVTVKAHNPGGINKLYITLRMTKDIDFETLELLASEAELTINGDHTITQTLTAGTGFKSQALEIEKLSETEYRYNGIKPFPPGLTGITPLWSEPNNYVNFGNQAANADQLIAKTTSTLPFTVIHNDILKDSLTNTVDSLDDIDNSLVTGWEDYLNTRVTLTGSNPLTGDVTDRVAIPLTSTNVGTGVITDYRTGETTETVTDTLENATDATIGGGGSHLPLPISTATDLGLYSLWNPSGQEMRDLSSYLWSNNLLDTLKKMWNNPMELIISIGLIPFKPSHSASKKALKLGTQNVGINMYKIENQFQRIDMGSVKVPEEFKNFIDYETRISIYLPFIGMQELKASDIIGSTISLEYNVDLLNGNTLASLTIKRERDALSNVLYRYTGNIISVIPLSSSDFSRVYSSAIQVGANLATGNAMGVIGAISSAGISYASTGSISGNSGFLGSYTPYIVLEQPVPVYPNNYNNLRGTPSQVGTKIKNLNGFNIIEQVHVDGFDATEQEKQEIERILKGGFIV